MVIGVISEKPILPYCWEQPFSERLVMAAGLRA